MTGSVELVLNEAFSGRKVTEIDEAPDSGNQGNLTVQVWFEDGSCVFLKIRVDGNGERDQREIAATKYAGAHCGVRVPEVVTSDSAFDPPYLATTPLCGTPASEALESGDSDEREKVARDIGRAVGGITSARLNDHGWITDGDDDRLNLETGPWSAVLANAIEREAKDVPYPDRFSHVPGQVASLLQDNSDVLDGAKPALIHQDIRPGNVFQNEQPGVIDWEWTLVGDPALGLCWGEAWVTERAAVPESDRGQLRTAVREGYRERAGELPAEFERRRPFYQVVTFLPKPKTFDLWASDASESTEDLANWVHGEVEERISKAEDIE